MLSIHICAVAWIFLPFLPFFLLSNNVSALSPLDQQKLFMPPPTTVGGEHYVLGRTSVRCPLFVNIYFTQRDISVISGWIF